MLLVSCLHHQLPVGWFCDGASLVFIKHHLTEASYLVTSVCKSKDSVRPRCVTKGYCVLYSYLNNIC